jgi:hypothetical protein
MKRMKLEGCVADGLLNGDYPGDDRTVSLVNRSKCYYLHRAIETWLAPPDFKKIREVKSKLRDGFLYGMFIAEAIDTNEQYADPDEGRFFNFGDMCRDGSKNFWGEHTCKPSFAREEYRKYLRLITRTAMDMDVQVFLFGQVHLQDVSDLSKTVMPDVIREMREYADRRGMKILIGAQTNDISDPKYLSQFDYIEGGVGINGGGAIENGPCLSRWWKKPGDWCWGLLWNERYSKNANNVLLHLDWNGTAGDDMDTFAGMNKGTRDYTLKGLYEYFTNRHFGFLLPMLTPLYRENGGCHGPSRHFYTPDDRYDCKDEDTINGLLGSKGR